VKAASVINNAEEDEEHNYRPYMIETKDKFGYESVGHMRADITRGYTYKYWEDYLNADKE